MTEEDDVSDETYRQSLSEIATDMALLLNKGKNPTKIDILTNLTIVVIGKTGEGKSSTANTFLGDRLFPTGFGTKSDTQTTTCRECFITGFDDLPAIKLKVIDTPGLFDQVELSEELTKTEDKLKRLEESDDFGRIKRERKYLQTKIEDLRRYFDIKEELDQIKKSKQTKNADQQRRKNQLEQQMESIEEKLDNERNGVLQGEIKKCANLCGSGVDAFFVVISCASRYTRDTKDTRKVLAEMFGSDNLYKYLFIAFTHFDVAKEKGFDENSFVEDMHADLKQFMKDVNNRYFFIDNKVVENLDIKNKMLVNEQRRCIFRQVMENVSSQGFRFTSNHFAVPEMKRLRRSIEDTFEQFEDMWNEKMDAISRFEEEYNAVNANTHSLQKRAAFTGLMFGSLLNVLGIGLAIPTLGSSLLLTAVGTGTMLAGGTVGLGKHIWSRSKKKQILEQTEQHLISFAQPFEDFKRKLVIAEFTLFSTKLEFWPNAKSENSENRPDWGSFNKSQYETDDSINKRTDPTTNVIDNSKQQLSELGKVVFEGKTNTIKGKETFEKMKIACDESFQNICDKKNAIVEDIDEFCNNPIDSCMCTICRELWTDPVVCPTSFKHIFCNVCIYKWLEQKRQCPLCSELWPRDSTRRRPRPTHF